MEQTSFTGLITSSFDFNGKISGAWTISTPNYNLKRGKKIS